MGVDLGFVAREYKSSVIDPGILNQTSGSEEREVEAGMVMQSIHVCLTGIGMLHLADLASQDFDLFGLCNAILLSKA